MSLGRIARRWSSINISRRWSSTSSALNEVDAGREAFLNSLVVALHADPTLLPQLAARLDPALRATLLEESAHGGGGGKWEVQRRLIALREAAGSLGECHQAALQAADTNKDGYISSEELGAWLRKALRSDYTAATVNASCMPPTSKQLMQLALLAGVPFIGFGAVDNGVMLLAGDAIDANLGISFGVSTLAAAGLGNLVSNIAGLGVGPSAHMGEHANIAGEPLVQEHSRKGGRSECDNLQSVLALDTGWRPDRERVQKAPRAKGPKAEPGAAGHAEHAARLVRGHGDGHLGRLHPGARRATLHARRGRGGGGA